MPIPWLMMGINAGLGALKHFAVDKPDARAQNKLLAERWRLYPYTGQIPTGSVARPSLIGNVIGGAIGGASLGQKMQAMDLQNQIGEEQLKYLQADTDRIKNGLGPMRAPQMIFSVGGPGAGGGGFMLPAGHGSYDPSAWFNMV